MRALFFWTSLLNPRLSIVDSFDVSRAIVFLSKCQSTCNTTENAASNYFDPSGDVN